MATLTNAQVMSSTDRHVMGNRACVGSTLLATLALLGACSANDAGSREPSAAAPSSAFMVSTAPATVPASSPQSKPWVDLRVGECVADVPAVDVGEARVAVVDCSGPHQAEVYLSAPVAVDAAIADVADRKCAAGVDDYTGDSAEPALTVTYLIDSGQDRTGATPLPSTVICLLQGADGEALVKSVRN